MRVTALFAGDKVDRAVAFCMCWVWCYRWRGDALVFVARVSAHLFWWKFGQWRNCIRIRPILWMEILWRKALICLKDFGQVELMCFFDSEGWQLWWWWAQFGIRGRWISKRRKKWDSEILRESSTINFQSRSRVFRCHGVVALAVAWEFFFWYPFEPENVVTLPLCVFRNPLLTRRCSVV